MASEDSYDSIIASDWSWENCYNWDKMPESVKKLIGEADDSIVNSYNSQLQNPTNSTRNWYHSTRNRYHSTTTLN